MASMHHLTAGSPQAAKRWLTFQQALYKSKPSCMCSFLNMQMCVCDTDTDKNKIQLYNRITAYAAKQNAARARTSFRKFMGTPVLRMRAIWLGELKPAQ